MKGRQRRQERDQARKPRVIIIVQARLGSSRLARKPLKEVLGRPLLSFLIERLRRCKYADEIVVATTTNPLDDKLVTVCKKLGVQLFRGSEEDVLDRYTKAAASFHADAIVRITADCPLHDPSIIDETIRLFLRKYPSIDYASNVLVRRYPRGLDTEVFSVEALNKAWQEADKIYDREHVTSYMYTHPQKFHLAGLEYDKDLSFHRWTVDTEDDFTLIAKIYEKLYPVKPDFGMGDVLELFETHPSWIHINAHVRQKGPYD